MPNQSTSFNLFSKLEEIAGWMVFLRENNLSEAYNEIKANPFDTDTQMHDEKDDYNYHVRERKYRLGINRNEHNFKCEADAQTSDARIGELFSSKATSFVQVRKDFLMFLGLCALLKEAKIGGEQQEIVKSQIIVTLNKIIQAFLNKLETSNTSNLNAVRNNISMFLSIELVHTHIKDIPIYLSREAIRASAAAGGGAVTKMGPYYSRTNEPIESCNLLDWIGEPTILDSFISLAEKLAEPGYLPIKWHTDSSKPRDNYSLSHDSSIGKLILGDTQIGLDEIGDPEIYSSLVQKGENLFPSTESMPPAAAAIEVTPSDDAQGLLMISRTHSQHVGDELEEIPLAEGNNFEASPIVTAELTPEEKRALWRVMCKKGHRYFPSSALNAITQEMLLSVLVSGWKIAEEKIQQLWDLIKRTPLVHGEYYHNGNRLRYGTSATDAKFVYDNFFDKNDILRSMFLNYLLSAERNALWNESELIKFFKKSTCYKLLLDIARYQNQEGKAVTYKISEVPVIQPQVRSQVSNQSLADFCGTGEEKLVNLRWHLGVQDKKSARDVDFDIINPTKTALEDLRQLLGKAFYQLHHYRATVGKVVDNLSKSDTSSLLAQRTDMIQVITDLFGEMKKLVEKGDLSPQEVLKILSAEIVDISGNEPAYYKLASLAVWITASQGVFAAFEALTDQLKLKKGINAAFTWELEMRILKGGQVRNRLEGLLPQSIKQEFEQLSSQEVLNVLYPLMQQTRIVYFLMDDEREYRYYNNQTLQCPSPTVEDIYKQIKELPVSERSALLYNILFTVNTEYNTDPAIKFFSKLEKKQYICYLAAEYMIAQMELEGRIPKNFEGCAGANDLRIRPEIQALLGALNCNASGLNSTQKALLYKKDLRKAIKNLPHLEQKVVFQRRLLIPGNNLHTFITEERWHVFRLNFHLRSQVSKAERDERQTLMLLAILFFVKNTGLPQNIKEILEQEVTNFIRTQAQAKEQLTEHHLFGLTEKEQDDFLSDILAPDSALGKLYREPRGALGIQPSENKGELGRLARLKENLGTTTQSQSDAAAMASSGVGTFGGRDQEARKLALQGYKDAKKSQCVIC